MERKRCVCLRGGAGKGGGIDFGHPACQPRLPEREPLCLSPGEGAVEAGTWRGALDASPWVGGGRVQLCGAAAALLPPS